MSYDGAKLRMVNMITSHVESTVCMNQMNAFNCCVAVETNITGFENIFFLVYNQSQVRGYDQHLERLTQLDFDVEVAIVSMHWHKEKMRLYLAGTNGWVKCYQLHYKFVVTDLLSEWELLFEIRATMDWVISMAHDDFLGLLYCAADSSLFAFDLDTGKYKFRLANMHDCCKICQVDVDHASSVVTTSGLDGTVRTWLVKMQQSVPLNKIDLECPGWVSFARTGRSIITISSDRKIRHFGVSDSILRCEIDMSGSCKPPSIEEVIKPNLILLPDVKCTEGSLCVTAYQHNVQVAILGYAPEETMSLDSKVRQICFSERENNIMCLCEDNFLIMGNAGHREKAIDLDFSCGPKCKRSVVSKTRCVCCYKDLVFAGLHNGGLKYINMADKNDCRMMEDLPLEDQLVHLEVVEGMFNSNHPICGGLNPIPILSTHPFIVGFTLKGFISVWCGKCYSQVLQQDFSKPNMTDFLVVKDKKMVFVSGDSSVSIFQLRGYEFELIGALPTTGSQIITSFVITDSFVIVAGTNAGDILIFQIDYDEETCDIAFTGKFHLNAAVGVSKLFWDRDSGKVGAALVNGTVLVINPDTGNITFTKKNTEADPLSAVLYLSKGGHLGVFLAFGTKLHFAEIDTTEPEPEPQEEEEKVEPPPPEPEPVAQAEEEEEVSEATKKAQVKKRVHKLRKLLAMAKLQKKRMRYIPEGSDLAGPPPAPPLPPPKPKLTYDEVMEKNARLARNEYEVRRTPTKRPKSNFSARKPQVFEFEDERESDDEEDVGLTVQPFFYTDLPEDSKVMIPRARPMSHNTSRSQAAAKTAEKAVLYERNGNFAEIGDLEDLSESDLSEARASVTRDGRYMFSKTRMERVRAPTIVHQAFVGPPSAPRVLFNDPTTRNGLSFFDPRGFQMPLSATDSEQGSQITDADAKEMNGEEDSNEESAEQLMLKSMRPRSELEMRHMKKKKRVAMRDLMTPTQPLAATTKPKPKIFGKPGGKTDTKGEQSARRPKLSETWRNASSGLQNKQLNQTTSGDQGQTHPSTPKTTPIIVITNANIKQDPLIRPQSRTNENVPASGAKISASSSLASGTGIGTQPPPTSVSQPQTEDQSAGNEEPKIMDIGMKRNVNVVRQRRTIERPNLKPVAKEPEPVQVQPEKPPEPIATEKPPPPKTPPPPMKKRKNEHEIIKASMSSRKPGKVNKSRKPARTTSEKAGANKASTNTFSLKPQETEPPPVIAGQDESIILPPTQNATATLEQPQAPAMNLTPVSGSSPKRDDGFGFMLGQSIPTSSRREGDTARDGTVDDSTLPLLSNLSKFWEQPMLFPVLPFAFGNPNTATPGAFYFTDRDMQDQAPVITPVPFVLEKNGMDLVRRFEAIMDQINGVDNRPPPFEQEVAKSHPDDFIAAIPRRTRRPSM